MWLKHRNDVKWDDLPYIESAYFAQYHVEQALGNRHRHIMGLERLLWEDVQFLRPLSGREHDEKKQRAWARLQERIKGHEVVLVIDRFSSPLAPLFRWKADADQPHGGRWEIQAPSHTSGHGDVEWLLRGVEAPVVSSPRADSDEGIMVAGLGSALKGILQGTKKAGKGDKTPDVHGTAKLPRRTRADVLGKSEGGPGVWEKTSQRTGGEAYQEQISKVERGVEYKVKGVDFDGYDPKRKVLIEAKDWQGWPPTTGNKKLLRQFEKKTLDQARRQTEAASGTKIEWHVSTPEKAQVLEKFLKSENMRDIAVVHTPKL